MRKIYPRFQHHLILSSTKGTFGEGLTVYTRRKFGKSKYKYVYRKARFANTGDKESCCSCCACCDWKGLPAPKEQSNHIPMVSCQNVKKEKGRLLPGSDSRFFSCLFNAVALCKPAVVPDMPMPCIMFFLFSDSLFPCLHEFVWFPWLLGFQVFGHNRS